MHPADTGGATFSYSPLSDGQNIKFGFCTIDVIHSPGHTPGSTSFLLNKKYLFTGDTIMKTSAGRPDLGGNSDEWSTLLFHTLFRRFMKLGDDMIVLPSHATSIREQDSNGIIMTTLGEARKKGDLFRIHDEVVFRQYIKANLLENPGRYQEIRLVNLGQHRYDETRLKELEIGKNLCGMAKKMKVQPEHEDAGVNTRDC